MKTKQFKIIDINSESREDKEFKEFLINLLDNNQLRELANKMEIKKQKERPFADDEE